MHEYCHDLSYEPKVDPDRFWMVTGPGPAPTVRHPSLAEAQAEAERLCAKEGKTFYVVKSVGKVVRKPQPTEWSPIDG